MQRQGQKTHTFLPREFLPEHLFGKEEMHLTPQVLEQIEGLVSNSNFSDGEMTSNRLERLGREGSRGCRRKGGVPEED